MVTSSGLTFGIYPLSAAGTPTGLAVGPQDDYEKIQIALRDLRGTKRLSPRNYIIYMGPETEEKMLSVAQKYLHAGLIGDLVVGSQQETNFNLDDWLGFIRKIIRQCGPHLSSLQITNEPNLTFMEGSKPYVIQALVEGVIAAKNEAMTCNFPIPVGFGSVPDGPMAVPKFWENLAKAGGSMFVNSLDFVGHNFYVDVFEDPLKLDDVSASVERILRDLRGKDMVAGGMPTTIPIRVTENGWPTGKNPFVNMERTYEHQAGVLESVIRAVHRLRLELNITHYEFFGLRDADSSKEDLFHQFGIMRDDYTPKPAYDVFKKLVGEFGN